MFKRYAMSAISLIDTRGNKRVAFEDTDKKVVSFEYDPENFVYFRCRAITADVPNGNGDYFPKDELRRAYKTFVGVGMYKDHDSDSVDKSVGKVLWAEYVEVPGGNDYVECYCMVDRKLAPDLARRIEMGQANTVSMGCMVGEAECGVCKNIAHNQLELCEHMMPGRGVKGKKGPDGKVAFEVNRLLQFTELSLVTVPADPTAHIFEVFASLKAGTLSESDARRIIREEIASVVGDVVAKKLAEAAAAANGITLVSNSTLASGSTNPSYTIMVDSSNSTTSNPIPTTFAWAPSSKTESAPSGESNGKSAAAAADEPKAVARIPEYAEEHMNLSISYKRGPDLANSFFVAKEANAEFRVAAADVLPLLIQKAIAAGQVAGIATPEQVVDDLSTKCSTLADFKKWAKKRKKKNKRAMDKSEMKEEATDVGEVKKAVPTPESAKPAEAAPVAEAPAPAAPAGPIEAAPAPATDILDPDPVSQDPAVDMGSPGDAHSNPAVIDLSDASTESIQQAIEELKKRLERMQHSSQSGTKKEAVKTQENVKDKRDDGTGSGGTSPAKSPAAMNEIAKTENPKGHIDKGAALVKTASDAKGPVWSINQKELEKPAKAGKPQQAAPPADSLSWDSKEMASESVKPESGSHSSRVKQYFGRLPAKGPGDPPRALDLKSGVDPEKEALKKRAQEAEAEANRLKEKERLQSIADKIYEIVKALRERNVLTAAKEDEVITHLTASFKDLAALDAVLGLVDRLASGEPVQSAAEAGPDTADAVPQVFETVSETEDAIATMSRIWNL